MLDQNAWVFQVEPWTLGCNVQTAVRVRAPAVEALIPPIVGVLVVSVLHTVVALPVEPVLRLDELGKTARGLIVVSDVGDHVQRQRHEQHVHRDRDVLLRQLASNEEAFQVLEESARVERLTVVIVIVGWQAVIFYNRFEHAVH